MKNLKNRQHGFTIIEVMIVLVIAAVILLIVFLAVPALQRNSRNTQRRNDVANYAAAVSEWAGNHNGSLPASTTDLTGTNGVNSLAESGFLTEPTSVTSASSSVANSATVSNMLYVPGTICASSGDGTATSTNASSRQFTILFRTEASGGNSVAQCQAS